MNQDFCWTLRLFYLTLPSDYIRCDAIRRNCADFANFYDTDTNGYELFIEIGDCRMMLRNRTQALPETPQDLVGFCVNGDDAFPESANFTTNFVNNSSFNCKL